MLRIKDSESYCAAIKHYGSTERNTMVFYCDEIFTEDACKDLPPQLEKRGIDVTAWQCRNQSAVIVGHYADELQRECLKSAREVSDGKSPEIVILDLEDVYLDLTREMVAELETRFGRYSGRYYHALCQFMMMCNNHYPSKVVPWSLDNRSDRLNLLLENKYLSTWRSVFKNSDWSESAILSKVEVGLPRIVYSALHRSSGDPDRAAQIAVQIVYEDFFIDFLAGELRAVATDRLEPNEDLEILLGTVNGVVTDAYNRLESRITQRVEEVTGQMIEDCGEDFMQF